MVEPDLSFIAKQLDRIIAEQRQARDERDDMRRTQLAIMQAIHGLRSDITLTVKLEVGNAMLRFEDKLDRITNDHERRLAKLEDIAP